MRLRVDGMTARVPPFGEASAQGVGVVGTISEQMADRACSADQRGAMVTSLTLPALSRNTRGRPASSVRAWILVVRPPRDRPIACAKSPLLPRRRAMCLDVGRVDCSAAPDTAHAGQRLEDIEPDTLLAPAMIAIVDRRVRSIGCRAIPPSRASPQHVDDPADDPAIIHPRLHDAHAASGARSSPTPRHPASTGASSRCPPGHLESHLGLNRKSLLSTNPRPEQSRVSATRAPRPHPRSTAS